MTVVVDASAVVAALLDSGAAGEWAAAALRGQALAAPRGTARPASGGMTLAHQDLLRLDATLWPYLAVAEEAWTFRGSLTIHDASYVALARRLDAPLVTLDGRLARSAGGLCELRTAPAQG